ncbi:MAG: hypothetical protein KME25_33210 [Symplocastrum torsivum CPER-KK1]|uniref:Uncharacterized protein n=1 Tax=Symplocastrum torsivum CPER-KK1 TaxID=450513 RepID=A0A951PTR0_9CYAN|nr:hypothetical protein [Symplocastrum torsivum CPER-KK1]
MVNRHHSPNRPNPIFSLSGVDSLQGKGLRDVFRLVLARIQYDFRSGVDWAAETFTG